MLELEYRGMQRESLSPSLPHRVRRKDDDDESVYSWPGVNYEDENINVGLPVFSIHGNHDDPQGVGAVSRLSLCSTSFLS